ncbi:alpha-ketoglutarate-dependent dioxygenase AlkB [Paraburkholderia phytofirmans]|uniref:alpha-ketoglutarate-dependent dioxygenase AlkB n=1 Tax=Paraburkholderia phytofirmans TaxID=261302 RepID=UPI0038BA526F
MNHVAHPMTGNAEYFALGRGAFILRGFALRYGDELPRRVAELQNSPQDRCSVTPSGLSMSSESTTCFSLGWTTIERSQDCLPTDPPYAVMPDVLRNLGRDAAAAVGFNDFAPDVSLMSQVPGARVSLHQEMSWPKAGAPIVALTLGMASAFLFKNHESLDTRRITLWHGDVLVWDQQARVPFDIA